MAIDTESKRRSAQMGAAGTIRPVADGTVGAPDRAQAAWEYSGLTYSAPAVSTGSPVIRRIMGLIRRFTPVAE